MPAGTNFKFLNVEPNLKVVSQPVARRQCRQMPSSDLSRFRPFLSAWESKWLNESRGLALLLRTYNFVRRTLAGECLLGQSRRTPYATAIAHLLRTGGRFGLALLLQGREELGFFDDQSYLGDNGDTAWLPV